MRCFSDSCAKECQIGRGPDISSVVAHPALPGRIPWGEAQPLPRDAKRNELMSEQRHHDRLRIPAAISIALTLLASSCSGGATNISTPSATVDTVTPVSAQSSPDNVSPSCSGSGHIAPVRAPDELRVVDISTLENPASDPAAMREFSGYWQFMGRDGFGTGYEPCFVSTEDASWDEDTVVIGIEINGDARAYATNQLIGHIVNDHVGNTPVLVTY